jgi:signal transduction histidine kinase
MSKKSLAAYRRGSVVFFVAILFFHFLFSCNKSKIKGHPQYFDPVLKKAENLIKAGKPTLAFLFLDSAYNVYPNTNDYDRYRKYEMKTGYYSEIAKDYNTAIVYADSMLFVLDGNNSTYANDYIDALSEKGSILFDQKRYNDAFYFFYKAELIAKKYSSPCSYASLSNSLGMVLFGQEKYRLAMSYFKAAYKESGSCSEADATRAFTRRQGYTDNIALCYERLNVFDSAIMYYNMALTLIDTADAHFPDIHDRLQSARGVVYGNIGSTMLKMGKVKEAEPLFIKSIEINNHIGFDRHDAQLNGIKLADLYMVTGRFVVAFQTLQLTRISLNNLPFDKAELRWRKLMWRYYDTLGNIPMAYIAYRGYVDFKDSFDAARKDLPNADFNKTFESLSQQYQITLLKKNNKIETSYLILASAIALMVIIIMYLIWKNYRTSKKNVDNLTALNTHINDQNFAIQQQAEGLQELNTFKDKVLAIISHDLRGPIASLTALITLLEEDLPPDEMLFVKDGINRQLQSVNELVDSLLRWAASSFRNNDHKAEALPLTNMAQQNINLLQNIAGNKSLYFHNNIPESAIAFGNYDQINIVIRNILTNGIKFTNVNGSITLSATVQTDMIILSISDTGVGMTQEQMNKLFTHAHHTTYGTEGEKGTGLGLLLCKEYVENNGGTITVSSEVNKGTTFIITLPVAAV